MWRRIIGVGPSVGRQRLAAIAAGSVAVTASALAANSYCASITLDEATAAAVSKSINAALDEAALSSASTEDILDELRRRMLGSESVAQAKKNVAYVFAKPHANTPGVLDVIKGKFDKVGITVLKEGEVTGEEIDSKGYMHLPSPRFPCRATSAECALICRRQTTRLPRSRL